LEDLLLLSIDYDLNYSDKDIENMNLFEIESKNDIKNELYPKNKNNDYNNNDIYNAIKNTDNYDDDHGNKDKKEKFQEKIRKINFNEKLPYTVLSTINSLQYIEILSSRNNELLSPDYLFQILVLSLKTVTKCFLLLRKLILLYMNLSMILKFKKDIDYIYEDYNLKNMIYILFNQVHMYICIYICILTYIYVCIGT
jgi:hypothetical protein